MGAYGGFMGGFGAICHKPLSQSGHGLEGHFLRNIVYDKLEIMTSSRGRRCGEGHFLDRRGWDDRPTRFWQQGFDAPLAFLLA
jgi:hypothetical protein